MDFFKKQKNGHLSVITLDKFQARFNLVYLEVDSDKGFPTTFKGHDEQKQIDVFIKIIPANARYRPFPDLQIQEKIHSLLHPHLQAPYASFSVVHNPQGLEGQDAKIQPPGPQLFFYALVFQLAEKGNFADFLQQEHSMEEKARAVRGILSGLDALHKNGMVHGFLKPTNILLQDVGHLHTRLVDYNLVPPSPYADINTSLPQGAVQYMAPELIDPDQLGIDRNPGPRIDFWSFGVILFELVTGTYPFGKKADSNSKLASRICLMDLKPAMAIVPDDFRPAIEACLERNPANRVSSVQKLQKLLPPPFGKREASKQLMKPDRSVPQKSSWVRQLFASSPKEKISCRQCGNLNESDRAICRYCNSPLRGPESLMDYKNPTSIGTWAAIAFTLLLAPLFFDYFDVYQKCESESWPCNVKKVLQSDKPFLPLTNCEIVELTFMAITYLLYKGLFTSWLVRTNRNLKAFGSLDASTNPYYPLLGLIFPVVLAVLVVLAGANKPIDSDTFRRLLTFLIVGSVFYIIASLRTLQQIWKGSNPVFQLPGEQWKASQGSFLILSRWVLSFLFPALMFMPLVSDSPGEAVSREWFLFWVSLSIAYWVISVLVIVRINLRQNIKFRTLAGG